MTTLFTNAHVVTMDDDGTEHEGGWILADEGLVREVGAGERPEAEEVEDLAGAVVTPGLVNAHHHLRQNLMRARAQQANLFGWLCVHLSEADVAKFRARDVGVAHCPSSNMRLGAGIAPVRDLLDAGVRVGLGVDGSASHERGDLFHEVKQALLVARARGGPEALTARDALRLGTRGGAAVLGRDDIGELSPGNADEVEIASEHRRQAERFAA